LATEYFWLILWIEQVERVSGWHCQQQGGKVKSAGAAGSFGRQSGRSRPRTPCHWLVFPASDDPAWRPLAFPPSSLSEGPWESPHWILLGRLFISLPVVHSWVCRLTCAPRCLAFIGRDNRWAQNRGLGLANQNAERVLIGQKERVTACDLQPAKTWLHG
jgi:hypothetical protein